MMNEDRYWRHKFDVSVNRLSNMKISMLLVLERSEVGSDVWAIAQAAIAKDHAIVFDADDEDQK